jgi:hypothetical protein
VIKRIRQSIKLTLKKRYEKMFQKNFNKPGLTAIAMVSAMVFAPAGNADVVSYAQDFEGVNAADAAALGPFGENFKVFADVWGKPGSSDAAVGADIFLYSYGPFAAPNGGPAFSAVAGGEGGFYQGNQYLNIYSDYNNGDQAIGGGSCGATQSCTINTSVFRESTIGAGDIGSIWTLTFDAKSAFSGGIFDAGIDNGGNFNKPTSATAFIKTLNPAAGYATTNDLRIDMTGVSNTDWGQFALSINLSDAALNGQIIQFGFNAVTTQYDNTGVYYDNICFDNAGGCPGTPNPPPAVPVPAAVWLFGSGLLGLVGVARRRKS